MPYFVDSHIVDEQSQSSILTHRCTLCIQGLVERVLYLAVLLVAEVIHLVRTGNEMLGLISCHIAAAHICHTDGSQLTHHESRVYFEPLGQLFSLLFQTSLPK